MKGKITPKPNDIWVAPGHEGGQVIYHIKRIFNKKKWSGKFHCEIEYRYVEYIVTNTVGLTVLRQYPVSDFIHKPVGSHGGKRMLAVRPIV